MPDSRRWARPIRILWRLVSGAGVALLILLAWLAAGGPMWIDRWLDVTETPAPAAALVVLGGGTTGDNLPLPQGWERLTTAARLYTDEFAPFVIFSGGGVSSVSEAEAYASAAAWLGIPRSAMVFEPTAQSTADHGFALRGVALPDGTAISTETPLLVVTSSFHSRRALLAFAKAGFTHVRIVSRYERRRAAPTGTPAALTNGMPAYQPSGKRYDDVLFRMAYRSFDFFMDLREVGAVILSSR